MEPCASCCFFFCASVQACAAACPLIGAGHGRYRVLRDPATRRDYIARENRTPLESTEEIVLPLGAPAAAARLKSVNRALSTEAFEASVIQAVASAIPSALQN